MTPEFEILLQAARPEPTDSDVDRLRELLAAEPDWTSLVEGALHHQVAPLLHRAFARHAPDLVPETLVKALADSVDFFAERVAATRRTMEIVTSSFAEASIDFRVLKGPVLAHDVYPDPRLRLYQDLDVLVQPRDVTRAVDALRARGFIAREWMTPVQEQIFRSYAGQILMAGPDYTSVEVHWALMQSVFNVQLDQSRLWSEPRQIRSGAELFNTLSVENTLVHLCLHGSKDRWSRLKWIADLGFFFRRYQDVDVEGVLERARVGGYERRILLALAVAESFMGYELPAPMAERIRANPAVCALLNDVRRALTEAASTTGDYFKLDAFQWKAQDTAIGRFRYFVRTITLPSSWHLRLVRLPRWLAWGYVPLRMLMDWLVLPVWRFFGGGKQKASGVET